MSEKQLKTPGYFEAAPDAQGEFRVVTTHEYPMGWLLGIVGISPLTEKWEQGTLRELEDRSTRLKASRPAIVHPAVQNYTIELAEWNREQGLTLQKAVEQIRTANLKPEKLPIQKFGDPVI